LQQLDAAHVSISILQDEIEGNEVAEGSLMEIEAALESASAWSTETLAEIVEGRQ
jgi:hypothetical protein